MQNEINNIMTIHLIVLHIFLYLGKYHMSVHLERINTLKTNYYENKLNYLSRSRSKIIKQ